MARKPARLAHATTRHLSGITVDDRKKRSRSGESWTATESGKGRIRCPRGVLAAAKLLMPDLLFETDPRIHVAR